MRFGSVRYFRPGTRPNRGFSTEATSRRLTLSFVSPYQSIMKETIVEQVNLSTTEGDLGVLGGHVPSILQLKPGLIEIFEGPASSPSTQKRSFFVSGGFAMINPDSSMEISAIEAVPVDQLDLKAVSEGLAEVTRRAVAPKSESDKAEILIQQEVYQAMNLAISKAGGK